MLINRWAELSAQWQSSRTLRFGVIAAVAMLWGEGLFQAADWAGKQRAQIDELQQHNAALKAQLKQPQWLQRREDAGQQLKAISKMLWRDGDLALTQAQAQDWLRETASKVHLPLQEVNLARQREEDPPGALAKAQASVPAAGSTGSVPQVRTVALDARIRTEYKKLPLMAFLVEIAAKENIVVVERMHIRLNQRPATAELDLRMLARVGEVTP